MGIIFLAADKMLLFLLLLFYCNSKYLDRQVCTNSADQDLSWQNMAYDHGLNCSPASSISSTERKKSVTPIKIYKELLTFCAQVTI